MEDETRDHEVVKVLGRQPVKLWYCQIKSNGANFLPQASNLNVEPSMS
jgi:hypothetical protein